MTMDQSLNEHLTLRLRVDDFYADYAHVLDDDRLEEWPDFFTQEVHQALQIVVERWQVHIPDDEDEVPQMEHAARTTPVLGLSLQEFAAPLAQLTDQEEMVISLIHPLVQVYTLPRTGQLAYVGHVCNFRQNVQNFFTSLPILPQDMPFVMVRPRTLRHRVSNKMPFKVNVEKLRAAFLWLKAHNPFYFNIKWHESAAHAWSGEEVTVGITREEDLLNDQHVAVSQEDFERWTQEAEAQQKSEGLP